MIISGLFAVAAATGGTVITAAKIGAALTAVGGALVAIDGVIKGIQSAEKEKDIEQKASQNKKN